MDTSILNATLQATVASSSVVDPVKQIVVPAVYCLIAVVGLIGNGIVLSIMSLLVKTKSVTDVYVTNLAIADILLLATLPFWAADLIMQEWAFGEIMCKIISSMTYLNMYASIFFLTAMSLDRWLAIVKAIECRSLRTVRNAWITSTSIWILGFVFIILPAIYRTTYIFPNGSEKCVWIFPAHSSFMLNVLYNVSRSFVGFFIPLAVIMFCYLDLIRFMRKRTRSKKKKSDKGRSDKVTQMVLVVISCFIVSWLPNQITNFIHLLQLTGIISSCTSKAPVAKEASEIINSFANENSTSFNLFMLNAAKEVTTDLPITFPNNVTFSPTEEVLKPCTNIANNRTLMFYVHLITVCLGFCNSMMNPIVYSFMGAMFRKKMQQLFTCSPDVNGNQWNRKKSFWTSTRVTTTRSRLSTVIFTRKSQKNNQDGTPKISFRKEGEDAGKSPGVTPHHLEQESMLQPEQTGLFPDEVEEELVKLKKRSTNSAPVTKRMRRNHFQGRSFASRDATGRTITGVSVAVETDGGDESGQEIGDESPGPGHTDGELKIENEESSLMPLRCSGEET